MTKYELSLTKDYVPGWTLVDAMRELFQNALDQETTVPDNTMFFEYHSEVESFHIGNKLSILEPKTLLLGSSTKTGDGNTIGKFGEGYKIAVLVLTRLGKKVTFFNYGAKEVWTARFSKSKKYGTDILVFEVDKKFPWTAVPNNNLTIVVEGITPDEDYEIGQSNLHMQAGYSAWETPKGQILRDEEHRGKMFVNGLFICNNAEFVYGYNFKPEHIELDRDRKLIRDFDLKYTTSQMWIGCDDQEVIDEATWLIESEKPDVVYLRSVGMYRDKSTFKTIASNTYESFKKKHGDNAVPVTDNYQLESVPSTHKPVIVTERYAEVITSSPTYVRPAPVEKPTLRDEVKSWIKTHGQELSVEALADLMKIVEAFE